MVVFYAFCRTMDDIADDAGPSIEERRASLDFWEQGILTGFESPTVLQQQVLSLRDRLSIPNDLLVAIIDGCRMDLIPRRFETWEDLSAYTWKVASAVGLVSIRIFGCSDSRSENYAVALGHALQLTNIIRDVDEDRRNERRIYLPLEDLRKFGVTEDEILAGKHSDRFIALMRHQAERAERFYQEASAALPPPDRRALVPALIMADTYHLLLEKMRADCFDVFSTRYTVPTFRKVLILVKHLIARTFRIE